MASPTSPIRRTLIRFSETSPTIHGSETGEVRNEKIEANGMIGFTSSLDLPLFHLVNGARMRPALDRVIDLERRGECRRGLAQPAGDLADLGGKEGRRDAGDGLRLYR